MAYSLWELIQLKQHYMELTGGIVDRKNEALTADTLASYKEAQLELLHRIDHVQDLIDRETGFPLDTEGTNDD